MLLIFLKMEKINEHERPKQSSLRLDVQIQRKCDAELIRIREGLLQKPRPLLLYGAHLFVGHAQDLKFDVAATLQRAKRALDLEDRGRPVCSVNREVRTAEGPVLLDESNDCPGRRRHLQLLQTTRKAPAVAGERAMKMHNFLLEIVQDFHLKRTRFSAELTRAAIRVLSHEVDLLSHGV